MCLKTKTDGLNSFNTPATQPEDGRLCLSTQHSSPEKESHRISTTRNQFSIKSGKNPQEKLTILAPSELNPMKIITYLHIQEDCSLWEL